MKAVIQRVSQSSVKVHGETLGQTSLGLLILLGIEEIDNRIDGLGDLDGDDIKNQKNLEDQYSSLEKDYVDCRQRLDQLRAEKVLKKERIESKSLFAY